MCAVLNDIIDMMEAIAPSKLAEEWDNVGLMLGRRDKAVKKILLALDVTKQVVEQAIALKADVIITHHPAIFRKLSSITDAGWQQELLLTLAEHGIAVYSAHTNLDCAADGVNDSLARALQLQNVEVFDQSNGLGRIGLVTEISLAKFAEFVKQQLQADYVVVGNAGKNVHKVAICGGAGADLIPLAVAKGVDTLVTGDVKYHSAQEAVFSGLNIIDAGHQATELPVLKDLAKRLEQCFADKDWKISVAIAHEEILLKAQ